MARHIPSEFVEKISLVDGEVERARTEDRRAFELGREVVPGVRLVRTQHAGVPVVFSLWTWDRDVAELCGDAAYPATEGLLLIGSEQLADLERRGVRIDLSFMTRSETVPGMYYALLDRLSGEQVKKVVSRLVGAADS